MPRTLKAQSFTHFALALLAIVSLLSTSLSFAAHDGSPKSWACRWTELRTLFVGAEAPKGPLQWDEVAELIKKSCTTQNN
jgi:hypothetical protein